MDIHTQATREAIVTVRGSHRVRADEPVELSGTDTGPTPYELLVGALGS